MASKDQFDIYTSSYWVYLTYHCSGLSLYSLAKREENKPLRLQKIVAFDISLTVIYLMVTYGVVYKCNRFWSHDLATVFLDLQFIVCFLITPVLWIAGQTSSTRMINLFKAIDDIDKKLNTLTKNEFSFIRNRPRLFWLIYLRLIITAAAIGIEVFISYGYISQFCFTMHWLIEIVFMNYGCMYLFLMAYYKQILELINHYIKRLVSDNKKIACLETRRVPPKVDICYKLEEIRFIYSKFTGIVAETKKVFQVSLLIRSVWTLVLSTDYIYNAIDLRITHFAEIIYKEILLLCLLIMLDFVLNIYAFEALRTKVMMGISPLS